MKENGHGHFRPTAIGRQGVGREENRIQEFVSTITGEGEINKPTAKKGKEKDRSDERRKKEGLYKGGRKVMETRRSG